jgi:beta-D-xylosidase 4
MAAVEVRVRFGHFDPPNPLDKITPEDNICTEETQALAKDGVTQSVTLLKNTAGAGLPWAAVTKIRRVAVLGPNGNAALPNSDKAYYGPGNTCGGRVFSVVDAVAQHLASPQAVHYACGVPSIASNASNSSELQAALSLATQSNVDAVVLALGTDLSMAKEQHDAAGITLPESQRSLALAVADAAIQRGRKPVVVVMLTATPLDLSELLAHPGIGAMVHAGQPSIQSLGIGDVIFGKSAPAGRLVQTIYPAAFADQSSIFDFNLRPGPSPWPRPDCPESVWRVNASLCQRSVNPGRTHRFYTGKPVLPFGYGLSYTTWRYRVVAPQSPAHTLSLGALAPLLARANSEGQMGSMSASVSGGSSSSGSDDIAVSFTVEVVNTGGWASDHVVLGFLTPPGAGQGGVPLQSLFDFARLRRVMPGERVNVTLSAVWRDFTQVREVDGTSTGGMMAGNSSKNRVVRFALEGKYGVRFGVPEVAALEGGLARLALRTSTL